MDSKIEKEFLAIYDELSDTVFRHCYFKTSDREVAKDLAQDTFMKVWDYVAAGNEVRHLRAFVFTVAKNLIKDHYKKKKAIPMIALENFDPYDIVDNEENMLRDAEFEHVLVSLEKLSTEDRELLLMRLVDGLSLTEIAETLGERENTISVRIYRAAKKLRAITS